MSQKGFSSLLLLVGIMAVLGVIIGTVHAQDDFKPPFYCMGMGVDCSDTPAPSLPPVNQSKVNQPCLSEQERGNGNFFSNFLEFFFAFFKPYSNSDEAPCSAVTQKAPEATPNLSHNTGEIQFIDHQVKQVPGKDMFITVEKPLNAQPGDILVAMIGSDYAHVSRIPPGWIQIRQDVKNAGHTDDLAMQSYYKIVTSTEDSYTWNLVTGRKDTPSDHQPLIAVDLYALRGVDPNDPIFSSDGHGETEDPRAIECPSVGGIAGGMLLCAYIGDDPGTIVMPGTMTQTSDFEIAGGDTYSIGYEALTSDGDTGSRMAVWNNPGRNKDGSLKSGSDFAQAIVLRPMK